MMVFEYMVYEYDGIEIHNDLLMKKTRNKGKKIKTYEFGWGECYLILNQTIQIPNRLRSSEEDLEWHILCFYK